MKRMLLALLLLVGAASASAQIGGSQGIASPLTWITYSTANPAGACPSQQRWWNTTTQHEWLCDATTSTWVDLGGAGGIGVPADSHTYHVDPANYTTIDAALDAIQADALTHSYLDTNYIIQIAPGTYSANLTFTNAKYIRLEGAGVFITGTITFTQSQQGGDYYSRVEFLGHEGGFRAEKGPAFKIAGNMAGTRNNDSLTYLTFDGVWITGGFEVDGDGTWVTQFFNSRMSGEISTATLATPDAGILIESDWTEFAGLIGGKTSLYNIRNTDFYGAISTTPWYSSTFFDTNFASTVSIVPQVGAAETTIYVDARSKADLEAQSPTLTGASLVDLSGRSKPSDHLYVVDPTYGPYRTVAAALTAINAEAAAHASYLDTNYVVRISPGTYSDALTFTNEKHVRLEGTGVELSGAITFTQTQQGGDYYSRVEFVGLEGFRAEKGPAFKISGNMTGTRNNDSLTYFTFRGVWITGNFAWDGDGTPVVQFFNSRMSGTIDTVTLASADAGILVESDWTEFAGAITDKVSLYNIRNSDFYGAITTTPWYGSIFYNSTFNSTVSIIPQGGAAETTVKLDGASFKSLAIKTPTLTGVTVQNLDLYSLAPTIPDSGGVGAATYTLEPRGAETVFLTCADADGCTVTMGEEMATAGQKLVIVNLGANDIALVDDDGTTAELDADANYALDVQLENVTLTYTGTYWLQTGFLDPS